MQGCSGTDDGLVSILIIKLYFPLSCCLSESPVAINLGSFVVISQEIVEESNTLSQVTRSICQIPQKPFVANIHTYTRTHDLLNIVYKKGYILVVVYYYNYYSYN